MGIFKQILLVMLALVVVSGEVSAKVVRFAEAQGVLSRDYGMASVVASGTEVTADGEYWLALYDKQRRYVRSESFTVDNKPSNIVHNYQEYFENVKYGLRTLQTKISMVILDADAPNYGGDVVKEVADAYPSLAAGYAGSTVRFVTMGSDVTAEITFQYKLPRETLLQMRTATAAKARQIVRSIAKAGARDYELELAAHDYLVANVRYDKTGYDKGAIPAVSYTDYGVLVNGVGVCQGYAVAANRLLAMLGVPSMIISGRANNDEHAWNLVKMQNEYCHLDVTYDDPVSNSADEIGIISHAYFNLPDNIIARDHRWVTSDFPRANTMRYSYYNLGYDDVDKSGNTYIRVDSQKQLEGLFANALGARKTLLTINLMNTGKTAYSSDAAFAVAVRSAAVYGRLGYSALYSDDLNCAVRHMRITLSY